MTIFLPLNERFFFLTKNPFSLRQLLAQAAVTFV